MVASLRRLTAEGAFDHTRPGIGQPYWHFVQDRAAASAYSRASVAFSGMLLERRMRAVAPRLSLWFRSAPCSIRYSITLTCPAAVANIKGVAAAELSASRVPYLLMRYLRGGIECNENHSDEGVECRGAVRKEAKVLIR